MARKYAIHDQEATYFLTFTVVRWIDIFTRDCYREVIIDSARYCQEYKGLEVFAYFIMTNNIHVIVRAKEGFKLSDIIRDFKSFTSRKLRKTLTENQYESRREWILWLLSKAGEKNTRNKDFQLWQQHNHPICLTSEELFYQRFEYIHQNPVKAGFVAQAEDWIWSSARAYAELEAPQVDLAWL